MIALVITIVVLIILATIVINLSLGENGIFNRAREAKEQYQNAQDYEDTEIANVSNEIDVLSGRDTVTISKIDYDNLLKRIDNLEAAVTYPVLFKDDDGWDSGTKTVAGISEYEEIGVYISTNNNDDLIQSRLCRCSLSKDGTGFIGGILFSNDHGTSIQMSGINLKLNEETLEYNSGTKQRIAESETTSIRTTGKVYKIVGITKKSQINEPQI